MSDSPIICFGQQPNGFFPKRFFVAKVQTARRMQKEMGGEIIYFCHDSDHDARETDTLLRNRYGDTTHFNFDFENKLQRKYSPLYVKRVPPLWHVKTSRQLPAFVNAKAVEAFKTNLATNAAEFCLEMYRRMGLLEGIQVVRLSDPAFRAGACEVDDYFVDVPYDDEIVRARYMDGVLKLHEGGDSYVTLPATTFTRQQISPSRDTRLRWMQSVVQCTHYICGAGEQAYLRKEDAPEITYVSRDTIERSDEAYTDIP